MKTEKKSEAEKQANFTSKANMVSHGERRKKRGILALLTIAFVGFIAGYFYINREEPVQVLTLATAPTRTDIHQFALNMAEVVERHSDNVRLEVIATRGASDNVSLLNQQKIDMAVITSDTPVGSDVTLVSHLYSDFFLILVRADSGIRSFLDLKGKKISLPPTGSVGSKVFWSLAQHYDLQIQEVDFQNVGIAESSNDLLNGNVDAVFHLSSLRDQRLLTLFENAELTRTKLNLIPINQAAAIAKKRPAIVPQELPEGTFTGAFPAPNANLVTATLRRDLVARQDIDPELIRAITAVLYENRLDFIVRTPLANEISQPDTTAGLNIPLHEGAEAFYNRDQPSFIQENAEPLALLVTVGTILLSGLFTLRARFNSSQKNRADVYNHKLLGIQKRALLEDEIDELIGMKVEINDVLRECVIALDTDDVTEEGFQSFSLLWEAVRETINDQISLLESQSA